jgi:hypothetical protein
VNEGPDFISLGQIGDKDKLKAGITYLRRTGARQVQIRYSDDEQPVVWFVVAIYDGANPAGIEGIETDSALMPVEALMRLCERLTDGGECRHCGRRTAFEAKSLARMPFDQMICWYQYDPELKTFRRGCE